MKISAADTNQTSGSEDSFKNVICNRLPIEIMTSDSSHVNCQ